jgi:tetratricopeptide (TPR) repeat protein
MKRPATHWLETESRTAFRNFIPPSWIVRDMAPDYGLDMEVEIVEGENLTNKVFWLQIKATDTSKDNIEEISFSIETKYLEYYENCRLPVIILLWVKSQRRFYHIFAQRFIQETLSMEKLEWRTQKTITLNFSSESILTNSEALVSIATDGYFYIVRKELIEKTGSSSAFYWLDGIPKSDNKELKERTLKSLSFILNERYTEAVDEFEDILRVCTISPSERIAILLHLGSAYYIKGQNKEAYKNNSAALHLTSKVNKEEALLAKALAFGGIGLVLWNRGELDNALEYHQNGLRLISSKGNKQEEADFQNNIGLIYRSKGNFDVALEYFSEALKNSRDSGYKRGEAATLGNIGLVWFDKGDLDKALIHHQEALKINRKRGNRREEALDLGNIGIIYREKCDLDNALKTFEELLKIHREFGNKQSEASDLGNIGLICRDKGKLDDALKYSFEALRIYREIGYREEEAVCLGNIGMLYLEKRDASSALKYLSEALKTLDNYGLKKGQRKIQAAIDSINRQTNG